MLLEDVTPNFHTGAGFVPRTDIRSVSQYYHFYWRPEGKHLITQYNGLLANAEYSSATTTKNVNFDFLITYLLHPGTAAYVGYNSNLENLIPGPCNLRPGTLSCDANRPGPVRSHRLINDGRQFFVKLSNLIRR
jgi:hypothetical protein